MRTVLRLLAAALLSALLVGLIGPYAGSASAAPGDPSPTSPSSTTPSVTPGASKQPKLTFGIGPALPVPATQVVDGRPYLRYLASPGGTIRDAVAVLNLGRKPIRLHIYPTDAVQTTDGTFGLTTGDVKTHDAGSWFKLRVPKSGMVTIPGRKGRKYGRLEIPFEARVPAGTTPGDHVAGIIASLETVSKKSDGSKIKFDQRIGIRAYFRISGPLNPQLSVDNVQAAYHWHPSWKGRDEVEVSYDVHNTGNVRMDATELVNVSRRFRSAIFQSGAPIDDILPGSTIHVTQTLHGNFEAFDLKPLVSVFPVPVDPEVPSSRGFVQGQTSVFAWQWPLILLVLLLLLLLIGITWRWRRRRRNARRDLPGAPGSRRAGRGSAKGGKGAKGDKPGRKRDPQPVGRVASALGTGALALGGLALGTCVGVPTAHADVSQPGGGRIFLEAGRPTGDPGRALTDGVWGHEGAHHDLGTYVDMDLTASNSKVSDAAQAFWLKRFGVDTFDDLGIAFVRTSADGSAERPAVHDGENAGEAFEWFTDSGPTTGWTGTDHEYTDQVAVVHTLDEYRDWIRDGKPDQVFDRRMVAHDALRPGVPVSAHPSGRSIQNRWAPGQRISLVVYAFHGYDDNGIPLVAADDTGHARTAWLSFRTEANPADPSVATSGAYHVIGASPLPKKPDEVSDDPSAEVNGAGSGTDGGKPGQASAGTSPAADGSSATGGADGSGASTAHAAAADAGVGTLWTGSHWAWPTLGMLLVLGGALSGVVLLRTRAA